MRKELNCVGGIINRALGAKKGARHIARLFTEEQRTEEYDLQHAFTVQHAVKCVTHM
jgi:hypothetical protein